MRRRPAPDPHAAEVARRRLEALSRELGLEGGSRAERATGAVTGAGVPAVDGALDAELAAVTWSPRSAGSPAWPRSVEAAATHQVAPWDDTVEDRPPGAAVRRAAGRHALPRLSWRDRWGLWLAERSSGGGAQFGAAHLAIVVLLVAVSLAVGAWHTMRGSVEASPTEAPVLTAPGVAGAGPGAPDDPDAATHETASAGDQAAPGAGTAAVGGATGEVVVDVVGKVRRPGIAVLPAGSRVVDALEAAGGARPGGHTDSLNLARPVTDGEQIVVGSSAALPAPAAGSTGATTGVPSTGASPTALVNLNTADQMALETLPGVGPVTAAAILQWRTEHGGFTAVEELLEVSGIGDATLAEIAPHVTI